MPSPSFRRRAVAATTALAAGLLGTVTLPAPAAAALPQATVEPAAQPAAEVLQRWVGADAAKFSLSIADAPGQAADTYSVTASDGQVRIAGTDPATVLAGFNAYLTETLHQSVSWNASSLDLPATLPETAPINGSANVTHRFVGNDVVTGYTGPYRTLAEWKDLIDIYAMHGLNEVFMPVGSAAVYFDTFTALGYAPEQILEWIPQAEHQPWWLLQNMSGQATAMTRAQIEADAQLGREIADYIRSLGMTPVLPGYFGTVPPGFTEHFPGANIVEQGTWAGGYERPDWLDPTGPAFSQVANAFYTASAERLGVSSMYKADLLHEGGRPGDVDVAAASAAVQDAMQTASPGSIWVLLGWQANPPAQVVAGADTSKMLIVDGLSDRYASSDRESDWSGTPYAYGSIWNFGGHTTMGANLNVSNQRYFEILNRADSALDGIAILPEAGENNPAAFDFLAGLAWRDAPVDMDTWFADWAQRRYGAADVNAQQAWQIIGRTAYAMPADGWSEAADSIFGAQPSLTVGTAAAWSPSTQRYDTAEFAKALPLLLQVSPAVANTATYRYDLMTVARQVLANLDRPLLDLIKEAYDDAQLEDFQELTGQWLAIMDLIDALAGTNGQQLLGRWIADARQGTSTETIADAQEAGARTILTTWTPPEWGNTSLNDYANRLWNGLVGGYYQARWSAYFDFLEGKLTGQDVAEPDFAAMGADFVAGTAAYEPEGGYATETSGDVVALAQQVGAHEDFVREFTPTRAPLPAPPGAGVTYVSEMEFVEVQAKAKYGPVARNTEIGDATTHVRRPITLDGVTYDKGIGVNSPTSITINLAGRCTRFEAVAGIDATMDRPGKDPKVIFSVLGDGEELFNSGPVTGGGTPGEAVDVSVDVTGVQLLTLKVDPAGLEWWDRADWAAARVTCAGEIAAPAPPGDGVTYLSHLPFADAQVADPDRYGPVARDTAITDMTTRVTPPIIIGQKQYRYGLGVQAPTTLSFNLGGMCSSFSADVGIDATMDKTGKSPSVTFIVAGDGKELWRSEEITGGAAVHTQVDVTGVETLTLSVDEGARNWFDRANWADAKVTCERPPEVPPSSAAEVSPAEPDSGWYTSSPTVTLSAEDAEALQYRIGDGEWQAYAEPLTFDDGVTQLSYRAVAGDVVEEAHELVPIRIDSTAPQVKPAVADRAVTLAGSDALSGIAQISYSLDGGESWQAYSEPVAAGKDGLSLLYRARDVAGNTAADDSAVTIEAIEEDGGADQGGDGTGNDGTDGNDDTPDAGADGGDGRAGPDSTEPGTDSSDGTGEGAHGEDATGGSVGAGGDQEAGGADEAGAGLPETGWNAVPFAVVAVLLLAAGLLTRWRGRSR